MKQETARNTKKHFRRPQSRKNRPPFSRFPLESQCAEILNYIQTHGSITLYALTFFAIDDCNGILDIPPTHLQTIGKQPSENTSPA
ncbi:hypothetical protein [Neisseria musculi]|uniref:Uncharacterized protein n=1 Tax=Neisseria musculi TaxID=1815583 RepID=A0A7H1M957_9NEIS|nr:hypothetical protein [Neisseria musculi]QNT58172.1 hypothetical protein H7A79_1246 [Neisseria musculi]